MSFLNHIFKRHSPIAISIIAILTFAVLLKVFAAPPGSQYNAGETLDPNCTPGSANCSVDIPASQWQDSGSDIYFNTGSVGVGTDNPAGLFDITGTKNRIILDDTASEIRIGDADGSINGSMIRILNESPDIGQVEIGDPNSVTNNLFFSIDNSDTGKQFTFGGIYNGTNTQVLNFNLIDGIFSQGDLGGANNGTHFIINDAETKFNFENGNVGIGIADPTEKLDVDGNIQVSSGNDVCIDGGNCLSSVGGGSWVTDTFSTTTGGSQGVLNIENMDFIQVIASIGAKKSDGTRTYLRYINYMLDSSGLSQLNNDNTIQNNTDATVNINFSGSGPGTAEFQLEAVGDSADDMDWTVTYLVVAQ